MESHYKVGEVVVVEHSTAIKSTTITLGATIAPTIINVYHLKTMPYLRIVQLNWL